VAPSTDKEWIRALWAAPLTHIPDSLLTSIARPRTKCADGKSAPISKHVSAGCTGGGAAAVDSSSAVADVSSFDPECVEEAILTFEDADAEGHESGWHISGARFQLLRSFDYCGSLLSGRWALKGSRDAADEQGHGVPTLGMPCKRAELEEIFSLFEKGELTQKREPSATLLALVEATVDVLGCPARKINPLLERAAYGARSGFQRRASPIPVERSRER
jgi:hypothetical protein